MIESEIVNAYVAGMSLKDIQKKFGVTKRRIYSSLKKNNVEPNRRKVITQEFVDDVVESYESGMPLKDIYDKYNCRCDMIIYKNKKGNRINYLTDEDKDYISKNYKKLKNREIAKKIGVTDATISFHTKGRKK